MDRPALDWLARNQPIGADVQANLPQRPALRVPDASWLAGEAGTVRALRRHRIELSGYWRRGASEEDLRAEALTTHEAADAAE